MPALPRARPSARHRTCILASLHHPDCSEDAIMPLVSITRLRVRSWRYLPGFLLQSVRASRQAKAATGNLSVSLLRDADFAFWTRTVWSDETAMRGFMLSGRHRRVMPRLLQI